MHFEFKTDGNKIVISFVSSKERFVLGTLQFIDEDGDAREDVRDLLETIVENTDSPFFIVK